MKLPLPEIQHVREVYSFMDRAALDHVGSFVFISPDPNAGSRGRYSVVRVDYQTEQAICIGRELPLGLARQVAIRPQQYDGKPVTRGKGRAFP